MIKMENGLKTIKDADVSKSAAHHDLIIKIGLAGIDQGIEIHADERCRQRQGKKFVEPRVFLLSFFREAEPDKVADDDSTPDESKPSENALAPLAQLIDAGEH